MERPASAACEVLKYLVIHCKSGAAVVSRRAEAAGELVVSREAVNAEHQTDVLRCVTTISSAGNICGGLTPKKFLEEVQYILPGFSAKLNWTSEEASTSRDRPRITYFQMIYEADEKLSTLMTDSLIIRNFLHKLIVVHPQIRLNFTVKVNGTCSTECFGAENEPTVNLSNGIALVINCQHYVSTPKLRTGRLRCSRIHPVLGQPVGLAIPDHVARTDLPGELFLTPVVALGPCPEVFSNELTISSASIFLYGPSGLPLTLPSWGRTPATVFKDVCDFIDWKTWHLHMVPNVDLSVDSGLLLPDVSYQVGSDEGAQAPNVDARGQALLLFLFVDLHSGFPVQHLELWGVHSWLTAHLGAVLTESRGLVRDSLQAAVEQALERRRRAATAHQKWQGSLSVAVRSILSIVTGSSSSSFRSHCLQALQAADTQEFGAKLDKAFQEITQHRFRPHSCEVKPVPPEKSGPAQCAEDTSESSSPAAPAGTGPRAEKRLRGGLRPGGEDMRASSSSPCGSETEPVEDLEEDALWLQAVSSLSEWLSPGAGPRAPRPPAQ